MATNREVIKALRNHKIVGLIKTENYNKTDYTNDADYKTAKKCFDEKKLSKYKDPELVITAIALVITNVKESILEIKKNRQGAALRKQIRAGILQLNNLSEIIAREQAEENSVFEKIVFRGKNVKDFTVDNPGVVQFLKQIIFDEWETEAHEWENGLLAAIASPTSLGRNLHESYINSPSQNLTALKDRVAYFTSEFLNSLSPKENTKIVGRLLELLHLCKYNTDGAIDSYIKRGRSKNS